MAFVSEEPCCRRGQLEDLCFQLTHFLAERRNEGR